MSPPGDVEHIGRFEWERVVLRLAMPTTTKAVALVLAVYGRRDGSNIHPGEARLARELSLTERSVRGHLRTLREDLRLIVRETKGGSRSGYADTYRLGLPNDLDPSLIIDDPALHRNEASGVSTELRNVASGAGKPSDQELRKSDAELRKSDVLTPEAERPNSGTWLPPNMSIKLGIKSYPTSGAPGAVASRCDRGVLIAADGFCCAEHSGQDMCLLHPHEPAGRCAGCADRKAADA